MNEISKSIEDLMEELGIAKETVVDVSSPSDHIKDEELTKAIKVDEFLSGIEKSAKANSENIVKAIEKLNALMIGVLNSQKLIAKGLDDQSKRISAVESNATTLIKGKAALSTPDAEQKVDDRKFDTVAKAEPTSTPKVEKEISKSDISDLLLCAMQKGEVEGRDVQRWEITPHSTQDGFVDLSTRVAMLSPSAQRVVRKAYPDHFAS